MSKQMKTVEYSKEIDDVMGLFVAIVDNRKKKEELAKLFDELLEAVTGIGEIDDEFMVDRKVALQTIGYRTGELVDAFLPAKAEKPIEG
jgi:hypothetical protein